jgi:putative phage-type endonuclease
MVEVVQHFEDGTANPAWLRLRAGKFTGSRFADLMAKGRAGAPSTSRANLLTTLAVERLTGECVEVFVNAAMVRGTELEPKARAAYEANAGVLVEEVGFVASTELEFVGVSPDGLVDDVGLVEFKCPSAMAKHLDALTDGTHAKEYAWQIQGQLWVTGREWCDAVSFDDRFPPDFQLAITRVYRDESAIDRLRDECIRANTEVEAIVARLLEMRK